jgi:hypothetical protein
MSNKNRVYRRRREKLWKIDPRCHWCKRATILVDRSLNGNKGPFDPLEATIDHINTRYDKRYTTHCNEELTVLSCRECNNKRGKEREALVPKEELNRRSKLHYE